MSTEQTRARIAGLGLVAGFDFAFFEPEESKSGAPHVHLSASGSHAEVSAAAIVQAIDFGRANGLIKSEAVYESLKATMLSVQQIVDANGLPLPDSAKAQVQQLLDQFVSDARDAGKKKKIVGGLVFGYKFSGGTLVQDFKKHGVLIYDALALGLSLQ